MAAYISHAKRHNQVQQVVNAPTHATLSVPRGYHDHLCLVSGAREHSTAPLSVLQIECITMHNVSPTNYSLTVQSVLDNKNNRQFSCCFVYGTAAVSRALLAVSSKRSVHHWRCVALCQRGERNHDRQLVQLLS